MNKEDLEARIEDAVASILATGEYTQIKGKLKLKVKLNADGQLETNLSIVESGEEVE